MVQKQNRRSSLNEQPTAYSSESEEYKKSLSEENDDEEEEAPSSEEQEVHQSSPILHVAAVEPKRVKKKVTISPVVGAFDEKVEPTPKLRPPPSSARTRSESKRTAENSRHVAATDPKRIKKLISSTGGASVSEEEAEEDEKNESKKMFQRVWDKDDEVVIVKGMLDFTSKTGMDPVKKANEFFDFIKEALHGNGSIMQLKWKIQKLKKKFKTKAYKEKNGEGLKFSAPHEQKLFELSKKVWANEGEGGVASGSIEKPISNGKSKSESSLPLLDGKEFKRMDIDTLTLHGPDEDMVKKGLEFMDASQRDELAGEWHELKVAEFELFVKCQQLFLKRQQLIEKQSRLTLEAYKSSNR